MADNVIQLPIPKPNDILEAEIKSKNDRRKVPNEPSKRSPFYKMPRGFEVFQIYRNKDTRATIGKLAQKPGGKEAWDLILDAIDAGLLQANDYGTSSNRTPSLTLLFPNARSLRYCTQFNLADRGDRQFIRDRILPAAIANKDTIIAHPEQLETIVREYWRGRELTIKAEAIQKKIKTAVEKMPPTQSEVIMYGKQMWPPVDVHDLGGEYTYEQLCTATWQFRDLNGWLMTTNDSSPGSRCIHIRLSTKWLMQFIEKCDPDAKKTKRVLQLVIAIAGLMKDNPEGSCQYPIIGGW